MLTKAQQYKQKHRFKITPHVFNKKVFHWDMCSGCGMVLLKNDRSRKKARRQCESMEE